MRTALTSAVYVKTAYFGDAHAEVVGPGRFRLGGGPITTAYEGDLAVMYENITYIPNGGFSNILQRRTTENRRHSCQQRQRGRFRRYYEYRAAEKDYPRLIRSDHPG